MTPFCRVSWTIEWANTPAKTFHGVMMSEAVYVQPHHRWTCIVATKDGNREMNPLNLTVTGVWVPGEPIEPETA